uniref:Mediator of RNA polymerase II transcription subunit 10 n=1 Tax=Phaeosphaeria nodorum (strain SN15 / ATCC MYA-4574 / FGSC 10173) TaxID=321614 RepID=MED10_PHANO|nr:RecName: Full=Mediator of RNA polymerase II transcription subunit 10; AltName: Full=Mediator complex subunit 10 [Parastagonospora nodorum SN15]
MSTEASTGETPEFQSYDHRGSPTQEAMKREIQSLIQNLVKLSRTAPAIHVLIPPEIVMYVEGSRNPDIYNREFVETVQRMNQMLKGRSEALQALQAQIAHQLQIAIPEMKDDIERAVEATGGKVPITGITLDP